MWQLWQWVSTVRQNHVMWQLWQWVSTVQQDPVVWQLWQWVSTVRQDHVTAMTVGVHCTAGSCHMTAVTVGVRQDSDHVSVLACAICIPWGCGGCICVNVIITGPRCHSSPWFAAEAAPLAFCVWCEMRLPFSFRQDTVSILLLSVGGRCGT